MRSNVIYNPEDNVIDIDLEKENIYVIDVELELVQAASVD